MSPSTINTFVHINQSGLARFVSSFVTAAWNYASPDLPIAGIIGVILAIFGSLLFLIRRLTRR